MVKSWATDKRVVIESVSPQVDGGRFPAKSTLADPVVVEADVFADGHDVIRSVLRHQRVSTRGWAEIPMEPIGNDRWRASFTPDELGQWQFEIAGWVDHFETWLYGIEKKAEAGVEISVELQMGAALFDAASGRARGDDAKALTSIARTLEDESVAAGQRLAVGMSEEATALIRAYPDRSRETRSSHRWPVVVDRERAAFSTWYELFPRSWSKREGEHGTFADVEQRLDYIADMGFDVLYLPPIHPIGTTHRKGANNALVADEDDPGVPWAIGSSDGGHTAISPDLGTIEDLHSLRDARSTPSGSAIAPTGPSNTPRTHPRSIRTSIPSTSRPRTPRGCGLR
jgi:starch synthase (maltosyl-transferring)